MMSPCSGCILASFSDSGRFSSHMSGLKRTSSRSCGEEEHQGFLVEKRAKQNQEDLGDNFT